MKTKQCVRCQNERIANVIAKCSDMCTINFMGKTHSGYVPNSAIGAGDYIEFEYCLECGQIQGTFPAKDLDITEEESEDQ
jgi:hypothetical protein